ncbi:HMG box domain-containing protein [Mycena sanguinolenta]|uniref:HMG box domain-containing protein n=1 Tax=Mycena sanguinolenta TaxID=230812 RepID=A0A8H6Z825_9AGAR|nr:HMG box domain-containing protein [Mycena sanguinolenta]
MPAERSRGSRRTGADGDKLVWTEPALAPGIAFATNLTPGAFEESQAPPVSFSATFPSVEPVETKPKLEPATPTPLQTSFFFFDGADDTKPKRASHKRKQTPPPSPSSPSSPTADTADTASPPGGATPHIPRPPNAFILFRSSFIRAGAVPSHIEPSHASLSAIAGLTWAALPAPEKAAWHRKAKEERDRHRERFPGYAFRPKHRGASTSTADTKPHADGDGEDGGGGGNAAGNGAAPRRRQQREVPPADRARQARIASLLLTGLTGDALDESIRQFDAERKEPVVEVRFGVVETPEGRVAVDDGRTKGTEVVRRTTSRGEKRRPNTTKEQESKNKSKDGKRRRVSSEPSLPSTVAASSFSTRAEAPAPFDFPCDFTLDALSIPSTPLNDDFEWPYGESSPTACFPPSSPFDSYPPSPELSHSSAASPLSSTPSSSWSSLEDLSMSLSQSHTVRPSPLSACSSMSSLGDDFASLSSLNIADVAPTVCGSLDPLSADLSLYGGLLPPYELDLGMGLGMDTNADMGYLTGYLEASGTVW